jgi:alpha-L-arabinofuranosidase
VHDVEIRPPSLPRVFAVASRDDDTGQLIVKLVNPTEQATSVAIDLAGVDDVASSAAAIVLSGDPDDANSIEQPHRIVPQEAEIQVEGTRFEHTLPPNSLSILRLNAS